MKSLKIFLFTLFTFFVLFAGVSSADAYTVTFNKAGNGTGVIKNTNSSLNCGTICSKDYLAGTGDDFGDYPDYGSVWKGWSGDMTGTSWFGIVSIAKNYNITATFDKGGVPIIGTLPDVASPVGNLVSIPVPGSSANGYPFIEKGIVWGTSSGPTINLSTKTVVGIMPNYYGSLNGYSDTIKGLSSDTTYYVRAYAKNEFGVGYSNEIIIKTGKPNLTITLDNPSSQTLRLGHYNFTGTVKNAGLTTAYTPIINSLQVSTKAGGAGTVTNITYNDGTPFVTPIINTPNMFGDQYYGDSILKGLTKKIKSGGFSDMNDNFFYFFEPRGSIESYKVCIDVKNNVDESNEADNCTPWQNVLVKRVPSISISANPSSGAPGTNSIITWNVGNEPDSCIATGDWSGPKEFSGTETVGPLDTARVYTYSLTCKNSDGENREAATVTITAPVVKLPDLIVSSGVAPTSAIANIATTYTATVKNKGEGTTGASFVNLFQTSTDISNPINPVGLTDYATASMATLSAGAGANTSKSITFPSAGTYYIRACADKSSRGDVGKITESDEDFNCSTWAPVVVSATAFIDLTASNVTPKSAVINKSTVFSATVKNEGNVSTGVSFKNFFQIATLPNGGGAIIDKLSTTMSKLSAGATDKTTATHTFIANGTYYIRACADKASSADTGVINESKEDNNCSGTWEAVIVDDGSKCSDVDAANYKLPGKCFYGSNLCIDPTSKNYGDSLPCDTGAGNVEGTCFNGKKDADETGVDCGGKCTKCGIKYIEI